MEICKNRDDLVKFNIKPNYATLAQKAGNNMKDIILKLRLLKKQSKHEPKRTQKKHTCGTYYTS